MQFFRIAAVLLIVIGISHLAGQLFLIPHLQLTHNLTGELPANQTEQKLLELMNHYQKHIAGTNISMMEIQMGLSFCYSMFFIWMGVLNLFMLKGLIRNKRLLAEICILNMVMLLTGAAVAYTYFFWLPFISFLMPAILFVVAATQMQKDF